MSGFLIFDLVLSHCRLQYSTCSARLEERIGVWTATSLAFEEFICHPVLSGPPLMLLC